MPPAASTATCPNCHAAISPGNRQCQVCKLEVSKMAAYAAAKKAAQQRGIKGTAVERREIPAWRSPGNIVKMVCLLAFLGGIGWLGYHFFGPKPPRYLKFPGTAQEAATQFLTNISGGDATYDQAYFLVADAARSTKADDDRGDYVQMFHILNTYLSAEFGPDWMTQTVVAPDPADPNLLIAKVSAETLHVHTAQQTPPDQMQKQGSHFGILRVDELDLDYVADLRRDAFVHDALNFAGKGAASDWDSILGATAANRRLPPFIKKIIILQSLRNPRSANWKSVVQANPYRTDPVFQARMRAIVADERYDVSVRNTAKEVLDDRVTEEEKDAVGV